MQKHEFLRDNEGQKEERNGRETDSYVSDNGDTHAITRLHIHSFTFILIDNFVYLYKLG